jgi:hypothetical protein
MFLEQNPRVEEVSDRLIEEALLKAFIEVDHARRVEQPDGSVRFDLTLEFLMSLTADV